MINLKISQTLVPARRTPMPEETPINQTEELIDGGDISCCDSDSDWDLQKVENHVQYFNDRGEKSEPRLDTTVEDYLANGEEYAYLFGNNQWECYNLHYPEPQIVEIREKANVS